MVNWLDWRSVGQRRLRQNATSSVRNPPLTTRATTGWSTSWWATITEPMLSPSHRQSPPWWPPISAHMRTSR